MRASNVAESHKLEVPVNLMKRILYLSRSGSIGGSQRQLYYLLTNLEHNYEPVVACIKDGQFFNKLLDHNITTHILPMRSWRKFPAWLYRYWDAERLAMLAKKYEVSLVHSSDIWLSGYMIWVARRLQIPSVLHVRTPISTENVRKHRCNEATKIIAISRRIRRSLLCAGIPPEKITRIHDSVDLSVFRPLDKQENVLRQDFSTCGDVLVGIAGRIDPAKHQLEFLQAVEQVIKKPYRNITFFLIGEVHDISYFKQLKQFISERNLGRQVVFTGRRDDIPQILNSLDILVSLSGGSVMFEAAACGKAVILAEIDGDQNSTLTKYVQFRPIVLATGTSGLAEALIRLVNDPGLRKQIGWKSRKWAESSFCHFAMAAKTQKVYEKLLS